MARCLAHQHGRCLAAGERARLRGCRVRRLAAARGIGTHKMTDSGPSSCRHKGPKEKLTSIVWAPCSRASHARRHCWISWAFAPQCPLMASSCVRQVFRGLQTKARGPSLDFARLSLSLLPVRVSMKPREAISQFDASLRLRSYKDMGNGQAEQFPLKRIMSCNIRHWCENVGQSSQSSVPKYNWQQSFVNHHPIVLRASTRLQQNNGS